MIFEDLSVIITDIIKVEEMKWFFILILFLVGCQSPQKLKSIQPPKAKVVQKRSPIEQERYDRILKCVIQYFHQHPIRERTPEEEAVIIRHNKKVDEYIQKRLDDK